MNKNFTNERLNIRVTWDETWPTFTMIFLDGFELWLVRNNTHLIRHSDHSPTGEGIKIGARTEELPPYHIPAQRKIKVFFDKLIFKETIVELWNVLQRWFTNSIPIMFGEDKKSIQVWEQAAFYFGAVFYFIWFYQQKKHL